MNSKEINELFDKYMQGKCSVEEQLFIERWLDENKANNLWSDLKENEKAEWMASLYGDIQKTIQSKKQNEAPVYSIRRRWNWVAAASILILVAVGSYLFYFPKQTNKQIVTEQQPPLPHDVAPGGNKAILTLDGGKQIVLDSAGNGLVAKQGSSEITKQEGQLLYSPSTGGGQGEAVYNTITTPRGGQYQVVLQDGTKVWLNAESSLRFPTSFAGNERMVELTGEGYFEVAPLTPPTGGGQKMPFIVNVAGKGEVEVLGTHFNINSYNDEPSMKTTLLEGSVRINIGASKTILKPGQQASVNAKNEIEVIKNADTEQAVAWKNGYFQFSQADIKTVMRQLARWYNLEVEYSSNIPSQKFGGEIQRNLRLSQALKVLEKSNIHFKIDGIKITVLP